MSTPRTPRAGASTSSSERIFKRNLGHRRAQRAWEWVNQKNLGEGYSPLARKLPSLLQVSGLGQTLAYLYGKGYKHGRPDLSTAEGRLLEQLGGYLRETQKRTTDDPMEMLLSFSPAEYRAATREVAGVAEWLKRFAEGKLA